jgi:CLIP-associating protein 1/2
VTQTILSLVELRRLHRQFPVRPFLSPLVEALEDSDGSVRDCARQSVITLFSGHAASDGARADLKNEMGKKGVRKGIVDGILAGLLSGASASASGSQADYSGSESSGAKVEASGAGDVEQTVTPSGVVSRPPTSGNSRTHRRTVSRELPRSNSRTAMVDEVLPPANVPTVIAPVFVSLWVF